MKKGDVCLAPCVEADQHGELQPFFFYENIDDIYCYVIDTGLWISILPHIYKVRRDEVEEYPEEGFWENKLNSHRFPKKEFEEDLDEVVPLVDEMFEIFRGLPVIIRKKPFSRQEFRTELKNVKIVGKDDRWCEEETCHKGI